jgi:uncharacterized membrane protein
VGGGMDVRLRDDRSRYWAATGLSVLLTCLGAGVAVATGEVDGVSITYVTVVYFSAWILFCLAYSAITWRVMHGADGAALAVWLREDDDERRARRRTESLYGTGGPSGAVMLCAIALGAVLAVAAVPELRTDAVTLCLAVAVVATTWFLLVLVYALHYARESTRAGGLHFPGHDDERAAPDFVDFVYVSTAVATGFATADISVRTSAMRREVTVHALVAFAFNTVVVALLVSLLISVGG